MSQGVLHYTLCVTHLAIVTHIQCHHSPLTLPGVLPISDHWILDTSYGLVICRGHYVLISILR